MNIDDELRLAAPSITPRTAELRTELANLVTASREQATPRRKSHRVFAAGLAAVVLVGGGYSAAVAGGLLAPPFDWSSSSGECTSQVEFHTYNDVGGEPMSRDWPYDVQVATRDAANAFAANYDFSAIDAEEAVAEFRAREKVIIESEPDPSERQPVASHDEAILSGVYHVFYEDVRAYLEAEGLPMETIISATVWKCEK